MGAPRVGVVGMVLRDAMLLTGAGIAVGLPLALVVTREMGSMLYGLGTVDVVTVIGSVLALSAVAAFAGRGGGRAVSSGVVWRIALLRDAARCAALHYAAVS